MAKKTQNTEKASDKEDLGKEKTDQIDESDLNKEKPNGSDEPDKPQKPEPDQEDTSEKQDEGETSVFEAYAALGDKYAKLTREAEISLEEIKVLKADKDKLLEELAEAREKIKPEGQQIQLIKRKLKSKNAIIEKLEKKLNSVHDGKLMSH